MEREARVRGRRQADTMTSARKRLRTLDPPNDKDTEIKLKKITKVSIKPKD